MPAWIIFALGVIVGVIAAYLLFLKINIGALRIDHSDPDDGPYLFLELKKGIAEFSSKKFVLMKVEDKNYISHE